MTSIRNCTFESLGIAGEGRRHAAGGFGPQPIVGVQGHEYLSPAAFEAGVESRGLSPLLLENDVDAIREPLQDRHRIVRRPVIHRHHVDSVVSLGAGGFQRLAEEAAVVVVDDDDVDDRPGAHGGGSQLFTLR